jgi:hypothetical protein
MDSDSGIARPCALRLYQPFPVIVRGVDTRGEAFEVHTVLESISTGDLSVRLRQHVEPGMRLFTVVRFSQENEVTLWGARVAMWGVVVGTESLPGAEWGVTIAFTRHRFLRRPD